MLTGSFPNSDWCEFEGAFDLFVCSHWLQGHIDNHVKINDVALLGNELYKVQFVAHLEIWDTSYCVQQVAPAFLIGNSDSWLVVEDDAVFGHLENLNTFDFTVSFIFVLVEYLGARLLNSLCQAVSFISRFILYGNFNDWNVVKYFTVVEDIIDDILINTNGIIPYLIG